MPVITISREYGSGAVEVARRICDVLGYSYFDKTMMLQVAQDMGISKDNVVDISEDTYRMRNFLQRLFGSTRLRTEVRSEDESALRVESLNQAEAIGLVRDTLTAAYEHDNVVIVGRGGQAILREQPGVLHVRLTAPQGARALRVKEREGLSLSEATQLTQNKDQAAAAYLQRFFDIDWNNPLLYHLIANTGRWDLMAVADIIIHSLTNLRQVPEL